MERTVPHFGPTPTRLTVTPTDPTNPDGQVHQTLVEMGDIIRSEAAAPLVVAAAEHAGALKGPRIRRAQKVWQFVRSNVKFENDQHVLAIALGMPGALELLITPSRLLSMPVPMGDCDCQVMLAGAMLTAAGVPVELVASASDEADPGRLSHVYLQVMLEDSQRYVLDCSHGLRPGWEVPRKYRRVAYNLYGREIQPPAAMNRNGLGDSGDWGGEAGTPDFIDDPTVYEPSGGWADVFQAAIPGLFKTGQSILQQRLAPLNPGEYVQTAAGVRSRAVPGAIPGQYPGTASNLNVSGFSPLLLLGLAGVAIAAIAFGGKR